MTGEDEMRYETISTSERDRILRVVLDRPERLNAFTVQMCNELEHVFRAVNDDDDVGAVIVTGAGRAFCAGMDLGREGNVFGLDETLRPTHKDLTERFDEQSIRNGVRDTGGRVTLAIHDCRKPVIAAINGVAVGIGATMTLAMDFRLAANEARLGFVFGRLGIVPEACSTWFLPRLVGLQTALEWMLTNDIITAEEALGKGLFRSIHPSEELLAEAEALAHRLIDGKSASAVALTRQMLRRNSAAASPLEAHRIESLAVFYASLGDGKEGVEAFREKRPPRFTSRASELPDFYPWWTG